MAFIHGETDLIKAQLKQIFKANGIEEPVKSMADKHEEATAMEMIDSLSIHINKSKQDITYLAEAKTLTRKKFEDLTGELNRLVNVIESERSQSRLETNRNEL